MTEKKDDLFDKFKQIVAKAEDIIDEQVDKLQKSGVVDKINDYIEKAGELAEKKIDEFNKSEYRKKIDDFINDTSKETEVLIKKAKDAGEKVSEKIEEIIDSIKPDNEQSPNIQDKNNQSTV